MIDLMESLTKYALKNDASYCDVRYQNIDSSTITVENGQLKSYDTDRLNGIGIRVIVNQTIGLASSTIIKPKILKEKVAYAIKMAKIASKKADNTILSEAKALRTALNSPYIKKPDSVPHEEKIAITLDANKAAMLEGVKNATTRLGWFKEKKLLISSEGAEISVETIMSGLSQFSVASYNGTMEYVSDSKSQCSGFEFILSTDWRNFTKETSELALQATKAKTPSAGIYRAVADSDLIGLILHEAFGHASEGDLVITRESVLEGKLDQNVTSPLVTIIDDGEIDNGYFSPYDDEGTMKKQQIIVKNGVLKGFLQSRETAHKMKTTPTGNARAQNFRSKPIVRQSNFYMDRGDHSFEELVEDVDEGLYICGKGSRGGEVNVGLGTFTFRCGPSYIIKNGEIKEMIRSVSISGLVLETLKSINAVGKDFNIHTSIFGGCGKDGQIVRCGYGGPHVRIGKISVGGG